MRRNPFTTPAARPILFLGLLGFTPEEGLRIESQLKLAPLGGVQWRMAGFAEADAWIVNGARTRVLAADEVCVDPPSEKDASVRLRLSDVDRPVAFSLPLTNKSFDPKFRFEMDSTSSLMVLLAKFSQLLRPRAMLLALADLLTQHAADIRRRSRVYHLMCDNRLVAVLDLQGDIGVLPEATLGDLARASWLPRPDPAGYVPDNFARKSLAGLLWLYARRTERDLLPSRYRHAPIHLKRVPLIAQRLFGDAHLFVLRELSDAPRTFSQLCEPAKFPTQEISRALTAFYLLGCVTSSARHAAESQRAPQSSTWPWWMSQPPDSVPALHEFTAPAELRPA